ncbi:hypothetical protein, variant 1 [Verruconis gallopava]|uniref:ARS-binding protein 2 n=1 Tax=Verruconis gallopava TaxID=253628 RepID=A0A0D1YEI0_9PEZI|nr:hypothetical protein, variant 1 [Verruconis gallopava]KIV99126.1 hypothetical protein, variant 1 [Verruconis gallopava]
MNYSQGGGASDVQHMSRHGHQYSTPQSATAPSFQYSQRMTHNSSGMHQAHVQHQQQTYFSADSGNARQSLATPSTPSQNASPRFSHASSPRGQTSQAVQLSSQKQRYSQSTSSYVPTDRSLPSRDVADATFDQAYEQFILYCNPSFPLTTDTAELKRVFRTPPKSDGKSFSTFHLFELLKKLENKELKTWTELALELGVERPSFEKGQSSQKVQQYSVRLKRWMRALHIDAFFEYLMGKNHAYYQAIPPLNDPFPDARDGVPIEEDLAIRAIDPKFRPKRGRRRADEQDDDCVEPWSAVEPKRPHLDTAFHNRNDAYPLSVYPSSAVPITAHPEFSGSGGSDSWATLNTPTSAMAPRTSQQLRWRNETPSTPHPLSAVTPVSAHPDSAWDTETPSTVTPSSARSARRRRHGPAVSSAWPSTNTTVNGKLRGRPPSNRSVRDGPFVTFPANPKTKEAPVIDLGSSRQRNEGCRKSEEETTTTFGATESPKPAPVAAQAEHQFLTPQLPTPISASSTTLPMPARPMSHAGAARPERLQLQVPKHEGGPVRLVTPTLVVNGQFDDQTSRQQLPTPALSTPQQKTSTLSTAPTAHTTALSLSDDLSPTEGTASAEHNQHVNFHIPKRIQHSFPFSKTETVTASNEPLLFAPGAEDLKRALVTSLLHAEIEGRTKRLQGTEAKDLADSILAKLNAGGQSQTDELHRFLCASWLGIRNGGANAPRQRKILVHRFRVGGDGYDSPLDDEATLSEGDKIRETFDVEWAHSLGGIEGRFAVRGVSLQHTRLGTEQDSDMNIDDAGEEGWRERYLRAEAQRKAQQEELEQLKARILDVLV